MKFAPGFLTLTTAVALCGSIAAGQTAPAPAKPSTDVVAAKPAPATEFTRRNPCSADPSICAVKTFYLNNSFQQADANEIVTALRNMLDAYDKVYLVSSQSAILIEAPPEQVALAQEIIGALDRPKKTYRLTYTVIEIDNGKRVGTQHFSMVVVSGQETKLKQGSKVPIATGSYNAVTTEKEAAGVQTQFTYLDVGMNFSATLDEFANGVRLRSGVEQSSVAEEKSGVGAQDPIVRQTSLMGAAFLTPGKPLMLGSLDIPGSTRHLDVEVVMEQLP
jgi:type II secretory pathway component GspD/PulD (secretin)